jgi:transcriptional regulator with PAS, ATPase and Fis domain
LNLTILNERLDQIESETKRRAARTQQLLEEVREIRNRVVAFIGAPQAPDGRDIVPMAELEKAAILHAVSKCQNPGLAAAALGISKTSIYRKLAEYKKDPTCQ